MNETQDKRTYFIPKMATEYIRTAVRELTPVDFKVLLVLHCLAGWKTREIHYTQPLIAGMVGLHITTVCKSLRRLTKLGYIETMYVFGNINTQGNRTFRNRWKNYRLCKYDDTEGMFK